MHRMDVYYVPDLPGDARGKKQTKGVDHSVRATRTW